MTSTMASSSSSSSAQASETPFSAEKYFATQPPPPTLESDVNAVREFVERHAQQGRKVVLVTVSVFSSYYSDSCNHIVPSFAQLEWWNYGTSRAQCVSTIFRILFG